MNNDIGRCGECMYWQTSEHFMSVHGEGCGRCGIGFDGDDEGVTFCDHQCYMCERKDDNNGRIKMQSMR